jgi:flagellar basal body P-ring formation protein FlgA
VVNFWRLLLTAVLFSVTLLTSGSLRAAQAAVPAHIELRSETVVAESYVVLGDIAVVSAPSAQLKHTLDNLRIGSAPMVGYATRLSQEELRRVVRARLPGQEVALEWSGAKTVSISSAGRLIDAGKVVDAARKHLLAELALKFDRIEVQLAAPVADVELPLGEVLLKPRAIDSKHVSARLPVWVDLYVNGTAYRSVVVPFMLNASRSVYVARRDLPEGTLVSSDDFVPRTEDVLSGAADGMQEFEMQEGMRVRRALVAGQVLTRNHVSPKDIVYRGDPVKLVFAEGGVLIEALASAQQEAAIGQLVKVKVEKGSEAIVARVVSPGVVQAVGR